MEVGLRICLQLFVSILRHVVNLLTLCVLAASFSKAHTNCWLQASSWSWVIDLTFSPFKLIIRDVWFISSPSKESVGCCAGYDYKFKQTYHCNHEKVMVLSEIESHQVFIFWPKYYSIRDVGSSSDSFFFKILRNTCAFLSMPLHILLLSAHTSSFV